jgi:phosphoserine phosphatase
MMTSRVPAAGPLPSWNDGAAKASLLRFVERVTTDGSPEFVPQQERLAVFDNDGTLCSETPVLTQFAFTVDRMRAQAQAHPEWQTTSPFREILAGDIAGTFSCGMGAVGKALAATYSGMTAEEFGHDVTVWMETARHPETGRPYTSMVFQPMIELIAYLQANTFAVYIVSASGIDFLRPWTEKVYGIPPERVIGSNIRMQYEVRSGTPVLVRLPVLERFDEGAEKPVAIHHFTGRRPILAFGDSDGDLPMLTWVAAGAGPRFAGLIRHPDAERAHGIHNPMGGSDHALAEARAKGWTVVDPGQDWKIIYPDERE